MQAQRTTVAAAVALIIGGGAALAAPMSASAAPSPTVHASGVVINEVESDGDTTDWIELVNTGDAPVDLSGWAVKDNDDTRDFRFAAGTSIQPGAYLVVDDTQFGFGLGKEDQARIFDAAGVLVDAHSWAQHADVSYARLPDGVGDFVQTTASSKAAANDVEAATGAVVFNEIESSGGEPGDWVELFNPGVGAIDLSGYVLTDNSPEDETHRFLLPEGTTLQAGAYLVVEEADFAFGLGGGDSAMLFAADGTTVVDEHSWTQHAATSYGRSPNGSGAFTETSEPTKGAENRFSGVAPTSAVVINEVESNGGTPGDWVEVYNRGADTVDISGWTMVDDNAGHTPAPAPAATVLAPGEFFVYEESLLGFGLGSGDSATLADASGNIVDTTTWIDHVEVSWARCADGDGDFRSTTASTKGALNACSDVPVETPGPTAPQADPWTGSPDVAPIAGGTTLGEDMSGLDYQYSPDGSTLWAVDNGTGNLYRLDVAPDGSVSPAPGWEEPKRVRFQADAGNPSAAGPDAEGVTVSADQPDSVYIGSERDNSEKSTNKNTILKVNLRDATGADIVATAEWDLTASLPQVGANTGIEAIEWIADSELEGRLLDENTGAPYDSANYPGADGLFFVAVEETAGVYAYALFDDGSASRVATLESGLGGIMALDYDESTQTLWGMCDNGCGGTSALFHFGAEDGTAGYTVTHVARPAGLPDTNNEGFAIAANETCVDGTRATYWLEDGVKADALKQGSIACAPDETPAPTETPGATETPGTTVTPGGTTTPGASTAPGDGAAHGNGPESAAGGTGEALATTGAEHLVLVMLAGLAALTLGGFALTRRRDA
ncbi:MULTISPECIES: lamin tail domain-containing protein [unclassified Pseudoclavibacter]|uniref:lamin tail domain-containing protein n=1 Tax=unclassified Pseudoclavibacter TaxID=2615177 RepID=UPI001BA656D8|nr:lamin tail domain-containing protein [Pseudoclavibacter sp. Marseille-Q4354]MBS3180273.1 lamin tail domain-containing protein [Pseudoclavibacter sp. Marseille-Q4354]